MPAQSMKVTPPKSRTSRGPYCLSTRKSSSRSHEHDAMSMSPRTLTSGGAQQRTSTQSSVVSSQSATSRRGRATGD